MPAKRPLTRERIIATALKLADEGGVDGLTMRKVAQKLGVEAMSLYHHIANKADLIDGLVDAVFTEIASPLLSIDWQQAMADRARSARQVMLRHPWAIRFMETRREPGAATLSHHEAVLACLRKAGFSLELTAHAYSLIDSYIYGFVFQELTLPFRTYEEVKPIAQAILAQLPQDRFPHFVELTRDYVLKPGYDYAHEFEFGLTLILDGLERAHSKR